MRHILMSDQIALRAAVEEIDPAAYWRECAGCGRDLTPDDDDPDGYCQRCAIDPLLYDGTDRDE